MTNVLNMTTHKSALLLITKSKLIFSRVYVCGFAASQKFLEMLI